MTTIEHEVTSTVEGSSSISLPSWTISAMLRPISNAQELSVIQDSLNGLPMPEMLFGTNSLVISNKIMTFEYTFNALGALGPVKLGELEHGDGGVKVGYAKEWLQSRTGSASANPMPPTVQAKPFDWTFTTTYPGHISKGEFKFNPGDPENVLHRIPTEELSRPDPILFYSEIPLFEDELHDNGCAFLLTRVRVMPTSFFILSRFFLRVDGVLFRLFDTRIYHSFASSPPIIVRETNGWEAPYASVKQFLPTPDLSPLNDPNFVAKVITSMPKSKTQDPRLPGLSGWRALGTTLEVCYLDRDPLQHS
ncbi:TIP41-like family-domain-containing protein [Cantharellus anzutake]|uniref:TIP41-like family-domain-containing protein n=1 Tax=Cantharellus anzutake TaxID=1750568 RepID=UPI0019084F8F|nr:TIP41-like family-domain-containing protein [Cantharellus anzutake]KAF8339041.1 TIP41-like family-domain-containing protein [Cantharellus anzutake]